MKILYFSFVELDIPNACRTHTVGVLSGFSNNACKVDAIVPRPKKTRLKIPGVRFYYIWPWRFSALGKFYVKMLGGILFFMLCLFKQYDAIYVRELELNPFPRWCSKLFQIPLYIENNSILPESMEAPSVKENHILRVKRYQSADFACASGLIVPSYPRLLWIIDNYAIEPNKVHMILNGTDIFIEEKLSRSITLTKLNLPEEGFYLCFLGNIWKSYDLVTIIKSMKLCSDKIQHIYLIVIGGGPELENLKALAKLYRLNSNIIICGYIQPENLFEIMGAIDIGLINLTKKGLRDLGPVTTRFATYAAYQIPVIANNFYIEGYPEELTRGLLLVPPEEPQALAEMICWLYKHPEEMREKAKILHDFVLKNLTWNAVAKEILKTIVEDKNRK